MTIETSVILALLAAIGAGITRVYLDQRSEIRFYRDRLFTSMDTTDEATDVARKKARGA